MMRKMNRKKVSRVVRGILRYAPFVALDGLAVVVSFGIALVLRLGWEVQSYPYYMVWFLFAGPVIAVVYCSSNVLFNLYRRAWRYAGLPDLVDLAKAAAMASISLLVVDALVFPTARPLPLSTIPVGSVIALVAFGLVRFSGRLWRFVSSGQFPRGDVGVLIVGAGQTGQMLAREMLRNREWNYQPVCFVDDNPKKQGLRIHGIPVRGTRDDIPRLVRAYQAGVVALAIPSAPVAEIRAVVDICLPLPVRLFTVPGIPEILQGTADSKLLREVRIEDLLGREPVAVDLEICRSYLSGRTVLITGAAGSIGSELSRQVAALAPAQLILFDNNESGVHDLAQELEAAEDAVSIQPFVGSVTNRSTIGAVFARWRPDVIFHAAAYKHVPLMEEYPVEAVAVNILGTNVVSWAAHEYGAERFVLVSTDKAVNPSNVMGATKRLAELIVKDLAKRSRTTFCAVRFGNVLGSRGSVVPIFEKQIDRGGPITITDPEATRYFMTIPEAASLIIEAGSFANPGDVFVLDMGEQIRIVDLAESMVRFRGLRVGKDIEFVYTGLRPGEKLTEELVAGMENMQPTDHPKVLRLNGNGSTVDVPPVVARLQSLVVRGDVEAACATLWQAVHEDAEAHVPLVVSPVVSHPMPEPLQRMAL